MYSMARTSRSPRNTARGNELRQSWTGENIIVTTPVPTRPDGRDNNTSHRTLFLRFLKILLLVSAICVLLGIAWDNLYIHRNYDEDRIISFYKEPENSLDVVLIGASDISRAYCPGVAYADYGITSYPFTINGDAVQVWRAQLDETMAHQNPDAVVIEVNGALYSSSEESDYHMYQSAVERMALHLPLLSAPRLRMVAKYLADSRDWACALRLLIPLYEYHSNQPGSVQGAIATIWDNQNMDDDNEGVSTLRGFETITGKAEIGELIPDSELGNETEDLDPAYEKALRSFLSYCQEQYPDTNILFVRTPHLFEKNNERMQRVYRRTNRIAEIIDEYGYTFLNCEKLKSEIGIDNETDFYDANHLNVSGMQKFTKYFSEYLLAHGVTATGTDMEEKELRQWQHTARYTELFLEYYDELQAQGVNGQDLYECSDVLDILHEMDEERAGTENAANETLQSDAIISTDSAGSATTVQEVPENSGTQMTDCETEQEVAA